MFVLPGFLRDPDAFFAAADAFLLTSREDPFPSVVLEALDVEVPVIAFADGGGYVELLDRGCGVLVPDFDPAAMARSLAAVLSEPAARMRLTRTGRLGRWADFGSYGPEIGPSANGGLAGAGRCRR